MGKGCCDKASIEQEPSRKESVRYPPPDVGSNKAEKGVSHNDNLLDYQARMEDDPNNVSLTKKILTRDLAIENVNIRGFAGEGLGQCVYPNVNNVRCLLPYAVSPDCYNIFADFFGEIIERINGVPEGNTPLFPDFGNLQNNGLVDLNDHDRKRRRVLYSDMIIRRNIQDIPFTPLMTPSHRRQVISQIEPKLRNILQGSEELPVIPIEWEQRMKAIFDELDDCESMKDYPEDRLMLTFRNDNNIFEGCILNFDDHIQFIVSTNDGRIGELLTRMYNIICNEYLEEVNYTAHSVFGHLTLSPYYVGNGFTIRLLCKFPFVSRLADVNSLIKQYDVAVVNEVEDRNNGIIILYSMKTLNKNEDEIFQDMILAFNKLSALEDELELISPMSVQHNVVAVERLDTLMKKIADSDSKSYTKKFLTENLINQYKNVKTQYGTLINNCIRHNAYYPNSLFPRAGDGDCYMIFKQFFNPILFQTNNTKGFKHLRRPDYGTTMHGKIYQLRHPHLFSYRVRFSRNLDGFPFPIMMSSNERFEVEKIMKKIFDDIPVEMEGEYIPLDSLRNSIYLEEIQRYKLIPSPNDVDAASGIYSDWPAHRGIFFARRNVNYPDIILVILINFTDHIKVISLDPTGKCLNLCYDRAVGVMKFLDLRFEKKYATISGYGFLTTIPNSVGCGLRISGLIKLANLGKNREVLERLCIAQQFAYRGSFGQGTVASNYVFDLSLKINLNVTEKYIVLIFVQRLKEIILQERQYDARIPYPTCEEESEYEDDYESTDVESVTKTSVIKSEISTIAPEDKEITKSN